MGKSSILEKIKLSYIVFMRGIRKIFFILPIRNNRVIFESFSGDGYSCNPKYISMMLQQKYGDQLEIIWAVKDETIVPNDIKKCRYRSFKHFLYRVTAKIYVCNFLQAIEIPKRKNQIEIQTWHGGGCYKKIGKEEKLRNSAYIIRRNMHIKETDYFITSSRYFEEKVVREQLDYKGKTLPIGMPRNDCLIENPSIDKIKMIRKQAGIDIDSFVVLYAPTWREGMDRFEPIDYEALQQAMKKRFGKKVQIIFRAHLYGIESDNKVKNLTDYPDMQELLYASDALITDYSSSMWDFSLTRKPCFLYVPDLKRYLNQRGFDKDIYTWGFPVCQTNEQLCEEIEKFDEDKFRKSMRNHQSDLGTYETGKAAEEISTLIARICGVKG